MVERKAFLAKSKRQYQVSQLQEHDWSANNKKNGDCEEHPSLSHLTMNFNYKQNGGKKKLFLPNQSINIMYPNEMNMIRVPITKRKEIIESIQVCLIPR